MKVRGLALLLLAFCMVLVSCSSQNNPADSSDQGEATTSAQINITIGEVATLAKLQRIAYQKLVVKVYRGTSLVGTEDITITGTAVNQTVFRSTSIENLVVGVSYNVVANVVDVNGFTTHEGNTSFTATASSTPMTVYVTLVPRFIMMVVNFSPIQDSVTRCRLIIDGLPKRDTIFAAGAFTGKTVTLEYDYVQPGLRIIQLIASGSFWGKEITLCSAQVSLNVTPTTSGLAQIPLTWVGPPVTMAPGVPIMHVTIGKVGTNNYNGNLDDQVGGLVLWNKLGSQFEIQHSMIGDAGICMGNWNDCQFVEGQQGGSFAASYNQDNLIRFPFNSFPSDSGCIEFWARLSGFPATLSPTDYLSMVNLTDGVSMFRVAFVAYTGYGLGGLFGQAGKGVWCANGPDNTSSFSTILGAGKESDWHHYALVWNTRGIAGIPGGRRVYVFLDGNSPFNSKYWYDEPSANFPKVTGAQLNLNNSYFTSGAVEIDNLKVWKTSKTNFDDRSVE